MDVADPSNFIRIRQLFANDFPKLGALLTARSYTDDQTRDAMRHLHRKWGYTADPHGAVGFLGLSDYLESDPEGPGIFLETAHPIKFRPEVEHTLGVQLEVPERLRGLLEREKHFVPVQNYGDLRDFLLNGKGT